jgi:RNA-binding protein
LKPLVQVGKNGLTEAVVVAIGQALDSHELIKVRVGESAEGRKAIAAELAERTDSAWVGTVGNVVTLFRPNDDPKKREIELPAPGKPRAASARGEDEDE